MAFDRPTLQTLITRIENDLKSRLVLLGALLRRSVVKVLSRVWAGVTHGIYGKLEFISKQIFADQSEAEYLERHASLYSVTRIAATFAQGDVVFTGVNTTEIPAGTVIQRADGVQYQTDALGTISVGEATIAVTALLAGADGNVDAATPVSLVSPIADIDSAATVNTVGLTGGNDEESDNSLRERFLERLRKVPAAGTASDYIRWAREIAGVTRVWVIESYAGLGTVGVLFVRDNESPIIPDAGEITTVQDYIDDRRPVTATVTVLAPTAVPLNFTISLAPDTAAIRAAVEAELEDLILRDAEPGGTIFLSQIQEAISIAEGENDHTLIAPVADETVAATELTTMGTITWA